MSLDVLMLAYDDWANSGWRYSECLKMLGLNVLFIKGRTHTFGYPVQGEVNEALAAMRGAATNGRMMVRLRELMEEAHVIHYVASDYINPGVELQRKNVVMHHGGTIYRQTYEALNSAYNQFTDVTVIEMPELLGHGAKNEVWISFPVDTERLQPGGRTIPLQQDEPLNIGHFPSATEVKGTAAVLRTMEVLKGDPDLQGRFEYVGVSNLFPHLIKWVANLKRLSQCDIYVEACELYQSGRRYGEWGNTVVEAAALSKVVVTNSLSIELYEREYGKCPLVIANSEKELKYVLKELIMADRIWLRQKAKETREWVVKHHSMEATARKLRDRVYNGFFDFDQGE